MQTRICKPDCCWPLAVVAEVVAAVELEEGARTEEERLLPAPAPVEDAVEGARYE